MISQSTGYVYPSLLSTAVINKNWDVVKLMIREGANVNEYGFVRNTMQRYLDQQFVTYLF